MGAPVPVPRLVALSPGTLAARDAAAFVERVRAALAAGLGAVLLREPALDDGPLLALARELRALADRSGAWLGVHDRVHVALAARADAAHLGFRSLRPAAARAVAGARCALGLSTHAGDDADAWRDADYLFHGPVRATASKRGVKEPIGFDGLAAGVARAGARPVLAIGGMRPQDVRDALAAGAHGVAVLGGILAHAEPRAVAERAGAYVQALEHATRCPAEGGA